MYRASTPECSWDLGTDAASLDSIKITFKQAGIIVLEKDKEDLTCDGNTVSFTMTQEETKAFKAFRPANVQIRIKTTEGKVIDSTIDTFNIEKVLNDEVL